MSSRAVRVPSPGAGDQPRARTPAALFGRGLVRPPAEGHAGELAIPGDTPPLHLRGMGVSVGAGTVMRHCREGRLR